MAMRGPQYDRKMRISGALPQAARLRSVALRGAIASAALVAGAAILTGCGSATASKTPTIVIPSASPTPSATEVAQTAQATAGPTASESPAQPVGGEIPVDPNALDSAGADAGSGSQATAQVDLPVPPQTKLLRSEESGGATKAFYNSSLTPQQVVQEYVSALGRVGWSVTSTSEGGWGPGGTGLSATKDQQFLFIVSGTEGNPTFVNACVAASRSAAREACT